MPQWSLGNVGRSPGVTGSLLEVSRAPHNGLRGLRSDIPVLLTLGTYPPFPGVLVPLILNRQYRKLMLYCHFEVRLFQTDFLSLSRSLEL